ncbi:Uncharacterised protein [Vibrio cholerae]|nr:Uncharacterised protein [Vibrio cholerae]
MINAYYLPVRCARNRANFLKCSPLSSAHGSLYFSRL